MASEKELWSSIEEQSNLNSSYLLKFRLYETRSNFYMIGRDKNRTFWRVLKIDKLEPSELNIHEYSTTYSENECCDLLKRIHEGNKSTGGLKFVITCYGIAGFIRFLGPYYMLLITKRRKIGTICGHKIYAITQTEIVPIPHSTVPSNEANNPKDENRYKKLLCTVDLTKDFFFSYSYNIMHSLQKNLCKDEPGKLHYKKKFVWNEFLTRQICNTLKNTLWTVALVYGFFKQVKLSVSDKDFKLTLIARRSRHYAGTRYLKRGVNEKGRMANDVETEQIVSEDVPEGYPMQISSVVQNRGSIPLFWSQETSRFNIRPDIICKRTRERKPRETILRAEFANAIRFLNKDVAEENRLRFLHWDLDRHSKNKGTNVLELLGRVAAYALNLTGVFYNQVKPKFEPERITNLSYLETLDGGNISPQNYTNGRGDVTDFDVKVCSSSVEKGCVKPPTFQNGVLRTNCIDCLDRTNVAQYAYGLVALGRQLYDLGFTESQKIDLDDPLAEELMRVYETMGDTLALQYGGSAAHNKIFSQRRGQWKAATQSQEFFRTLQRYYSNAYMDAEKQDAINMFLGHFQPQQDKPALWELGSDQHYNVGRRDPTIFDENDSCRSFFKKSLSDGNIPHESSSPLTSTCVGHNDSSHSRQLLRDIQQGQCLDSDHFCYDGHDVDCNCSNFLDVDWLSSFGNSCEEDTSERSLENVRSSLKNEVSAHASECGKEKEQLTCGLVAGFSCSFADWVTQGEMLLW